APAAHCGTASTKRRCSTVASTTSSTSCSPTRPPPPHPTTGTWSPCRATAATRSPPASTTTAPTATKACTGDRHRPHQLPSRPTGLPDPLAPGDLRGRLRRQPVGPDPRRALGGGPAVRGPGPGPARPHREQRTGLHLPNPRPRLAPDGPRGRHPHPSSDAERTVRCPNAGGLPAPGLEPSVEAPSVREGVRSAMTAVPYLSNSVKVMRNDLRE